MSKRSRPAHVSGGAVSLGPDLPELRQARTLWTANRFDDALAMFDQAVRKCPQNSMALVDASRAFGARFEIRRAEELIDRLISLNGRSQEILHLAGQSYRMIFRPDKAMDCFRRAVAGGAGPADARLELALLCERRHRLDEAFAWIEECLRKDPGYHAAVLVRARLVRRRDGDSAAESILRDLAGDEAVHPQIRAQAWAELGQLLDRQGQFEEAMTAMLRCKEILLVNEAPYRREADVVLRHLGALARGTTAAHFQKWVNEGKDEKELAPRANAVLCSFPRSGTTLLEQVLDSHSKVISSDEREAFARDIFPAMWQTAATPIPEVEVLDRVPIDRRAKQRDRYFAYMEAALGEPIGDRIHLDKNPTLTLLLPALLRLVPETKVLFAVRDPRDVVLSCFFQFLPMNPNSVSFLTLEGTARRYAFDMEIWRELRPRLASPWLEVRYEDTVRNLETEARRALAFLGLDWEPGVLAYRDRLKEKPVASPTYEAVSKPLYTSSIGRWRHYERHFAAVRELLEPSIREFGY